MSSGPSGKHAAKRRKIGFSDEEWEAQDGAALWAGSSWADWAREVLTKAAREELAGE